MNYFNPLMMRQGYGPMMANEGDPRMRPQFQAQTGGGMPPMPQGVPYANTGGGLLPMPGMNVGTGGYDAPRPMPSVQTGGGLPPQVMGGQHRFGLDRMTRQGESFNGLNNRLLGRGLMR